MDKIYIRNENVVRREIAGEVLLIAISNDIADMELLFTLNPIADFIWNQFDNNKSVGEILDSIVDSYDISRQTASEDMCELIDSLLKVNLIKEVTL